MHREEQNGIVSQTTNITVICVNVAVYIDSSFAAVTVAHRSSVMLQNIQNYFPRKIVLVGIK